MYVAHCLKTYILAIRKMTSVMFRSKITFIDLNVASENLRKLVVLANLL